MFGDFFLLGVWGRGLYLVGVGVGVRFCSVVFGCVRWAVVVRDSVLCSARYPRRGAGMTDLVGAGMTDLVGAGMTDLVGAGTTDLWVRVRRTCGCGYDGPVGAGMTDLWVRVRRGWGGCGRYRCSNLLRGKPDCVMICPSVPRRTVLCSGTGTVVVASPSRRCMIAWLPRRRTSANPC